MLPRKSAYTGGDYTKELIRLLQEYYEDWASQDLDRWERWRPDPYFKRANGRPNPSVEHGDAILTILREEMIYELDRFPDYHRKRNSVRIAPWNDAPDWMRSGLAQRVTRLADNSEPDPTYEGIGFVSEYTLKQYYNRSTNGEYMEGLPWSDE